MLTRVPVHEVNGVVRTANVRRVVVPGPVYPAAPYRRTSAVRFVGAATDGSGGRIDTESPGIAGLADFTLCVLFQTNVWGTRNTLAHQWPNSSATDSWLLRIFTASGAPASGTWADGLQFWIRVGSSFRFMNIPLSAVLPTDRVQLVIRGRLGLESSPGVLAPDDQRLQAWLALDADTSLTPVAAGHGDGYGPTTQHPAALPSSPEPFRLGGGPYPGAWDWNGDLFDALVIPEALSDAEIADLRPGADLPHFAALAARNGSWWRMGAALGDFDPQLADDGRASRPALLTQGGGGGQPVVVQV